jgi:protein TonB
MLAYAAQSPRPAGRAGSPKALVLIVAGHAALIAAVIAAKMDVIRVAPLNPIDVIDIQNPPPPPEPVPETKPDPKPQDPIIQDSSIDHVKTMVDMGQSTSTDYDRGPPIQELIKEIGPGTTITPDPPKPLPIKTAAVSRTPEGAIKPPYPNDKLRLEEEATLKLRLTIDARGRVIAVDPVGRADASFLEAARRHIIRAWRYKPAMEDGVAVGTTMIINLSFRLEEA